MKQKFIFILLFVTVCTSQAYSQSLHIDSTRFITGNRPGTAIIRIFPTLDKGILFTGYTASNPGGIIPFFPTDTVLENVLIGKIDSNRQISWIKVYGGTQDDGGGIICQTPDSGYAVLCGTVSNDGDVTGFKGGTDLWLLRIDGSGNLLWQKTYGCSGGDGAISIANTPDHGFIILGISYGSGGDVPFHYGSTWVSDWLVIKTDSSGSIQWTKVVGGMQTEGYGSILAIDSSYYIACNSNSTDHDCSDTAWHIGVNTSVDWHLLKLDQAGNVLWDSSYGGSGSEGISSAMYDTRDGTIVMAGTTNSTNYMVTDDHGCDDGDMWVVKVNKQGTLLWQKTLGSIQSETGKSICPSHGNGYTVLGSTLPYTCHDTTIGDIGNQDCWIFELDSAGNIISNKIFGGNDVEFPYSVIPFQNGYAAGGISISPVFSEGTTNGRNCIGEEAFISYFDLIPVETDNYYASKKAMRISPNPFQGDLRIDLPYDGGIVTVSNILGQSIYTKETGQEESITINTNEWVPGMYVVQWRRTDGLMLSAKLVKN